MFIIHLLGIQLKMKYNYLSIQSLLYESDTAMIKSWLERYTQVGDLIKQMPKDKRKKEFEKWNKIFKAENPKYDSNRLAKMIGLNV